MYQSAIHFVCVYTDIHYVSVYLVSDLEGSDNGDPINGIVYCHSCKHGLVTVLKLF
jgi:hypothetical protein